MSDNPVRETVTSPEASFLDEINWLSLWQASGNDWSWMLQQEIASEQITQQNDRITSSRQPSLGEILFTSVLILTVLWMQTCTDSRKSAIQEQISLPSISLEQR